MNWNEYQLIIYLYLIELKYWLKYLIMNYEQLKITMFWLSYIWCGNKFEYKFLCNLFFNNTDIVKKMI